MTPEFKVDFERGARIGLDEALFCESKTVDQISAIVDAVRAKTGRMLLTRLDQSKYEALARAPRRRARIRSPLPHRHSWPTLIRRSSRRRWRSSWPGPPICRSVARPRGLWPSPASRIANIRISASQASGASSNGSRRSDRLRLSSSPRAWTRPSSASLAVWFRAPVIALPTSVGYGVALGGATALHAALASCAPGISVVNIDNGYGAACAALRISRALAASQTVGGSDCARGCHRWASSVRPGIAGNPASPAEGCGAVQRRPVRLT